MSACLILRIMIGAPITPNKPSTGANIGWAPIDVKKVIMMMTAVTMVEGIEYLYRFYDANLNAGITA